MVCALTANELVYEQVCARVTFVRWLIYNFNNAQIITSDSSNILCPTSLPLAVVLSGRGPAEPYISSPPTTTHPSPPSPPSPPPQLKSNPVRAEARAQEVRARVGERQGWGGACSSREQPALQPQRAAAAPPQATPRAAAALPPQVELLPQPELQPQLESATRVAAAT